MNFQNECSLFPNGAGVISERRFVGGADFAQFRATRPQNFADAKTAANLDQFAARNDDLGFLLGEMANDQDECGGAIVYDCGCFRLAKDGESTLQISAAISAAPAPEVQLYIIIRGSNVSEHFPGSLRKRGAPKVGVDNNPGAVD